VLVSALLCDGHSVCFVVLHFLKQTKCTSFLMVWPTVLSRELCAYRVKKQKNLHSSPKKWHLYCSAPQHHLSVYSDVAPTGQHCLIHSHSCSKFLRWNPQSCSFIKQTHCLLATDKFTQITAMKVKQTTKNSINIYFFSRTTRTRWHKNIWILTKQEINMHIKQKLTVAILQQNSSHQ